MSAASACGDDADDSTTPSPETTIAPEPDAATTDDGAADIDVDEMLDEAPEEAYEGRTRMVHLYVDEDGDAPELDVWALRSFTYRPILLAEGLQYGEVTDVLSAPTGMSIAAVRTGDGPDGDQVASLWGGSDDEPVTNLVYRDRDQVVAVSLSDSPSANQGFPDELAPGTALVRVLATQLTGVADGESFERNIDGQPVSFHISALEVDGCLPQARLEAEGFSPNVLGGTNPTDHDLDPGTYSLVGHEFPSDSDCEDEPVVGPWEIEVSDGDRAWVLLHSPDLRTIEALVVPVL